MKTLSFDPIRADVAITEKEKNAAQDSKELKNIYQDGFKK